MLILCKKNNYRKLITMLDADMSRSPDEIPKMIKIIDDKPLS